MTYATYGPRTNVHSDRYGSAKSYGDDLWIVLHTSEGGEGHDSAENLSSYMTQPGDRPNGRGGVYGSSYHAVFDTTRVLPAVPYRTVAYSAGGGNSRGIHAAFPGKAGQTRAQWLDPVSRAMIKQAAAWAKDVSDETGIPLSRIIPAQIANYGAGVTDHYGITLAFRKSTHTDVGPGFPWDVFWADVAALDDTVAPPPQPEPPSNGEDMEVPKKAFRSFDSRWFPDPIVPIGDHALGVPAHIPATKYLCLTVTAVDPTTRGHVTLWASGGRPEASNLNFENGNVANTTFVAIERNPETGVDEYMLHVNQPVKIVVDIVGYL